MILTFQPLQARIEVDRIDDFAFLGPALELPVVDGLGKVLRVLRAARVAVPGDPDCLVDREQEAAALLDRCVGTLVFLELRPRSRTLFRAWTDSGVETIEDVTDVVESPDAYLVMRRRGQLPVRVPRETVVRQSTESERWYEVIDIERV